jgi:hypothetical protein
MTVSKSVSNWRRFLAQTGVSRRVAPQYFQWFTALLCGFRFRWGKPVRVQVPALAPLKNRHFAQVVTVHAGPKIQTVTKLCPASAVRS